MTMQPCRPLPTLRHLRKLRCRYARSSSQYLCSKSVAKPEIYDVVCVGGGPAGLSLVNGLRARKATSSLKIALIDSQDLLKPRASTVSDEFSNRCSSLTPASVGFLEDMGAWQFVVKSRIQPYSSMNVWDGITDARIQFDWVSGDTTSHNANAQTIAYMTENINLTGALVARARELGGIVFHDKSNVENIYLGDDSGAENDFDMRSWPIIQLSSGARLAARLLIGADGFNSPVRAFAGIQSRGWNYNRHGAVATVKLEQGESEESRIAYQRFLPTGPAALLPLPGPFATLVWSTLPQHAAHLKTLSLEDAAALINAAFRLSHVDITYMHKMPSGHVEEVAWREEHSHYDPLLVPRRIIGVQPGSIASFPLRMRHADTYTGERVALVGDAAHTIHPLAGQGLNQGLSDSQALVDVLARAASTGQDIGSTIVLENYNSKQWGKNNTMLGVVDKLHKLYSFGSGPIVGLRSLGLSAVDNFAPLKRFLMERAAGG